MVLHWVSSLRLMPCPRHDLTLALTYLCRRHVSDMVLH
ncbi:hypothetical protein F383_29745 [Gossypium arboreum]|uniref:Uncharacterized protein n=1 Tax=Gossypium arboreum TaxID=29729 RepID=A0A0B0MUH6_GOSAR|nr:hypothetical protein F383_29745 [Gossypium arboreum]